MNNTIKKITTALFILSLLATLSEATEITDVFTDTFSCKIALLDAAELNRVLESNDFTDEQKSDFEIELTNLAKLISVNKCEAK